MNRTYIALFYVQQIIKQPCRLAVIGSPARIVGGWLVMFPTRSKGEQFVLPRPAVMSAEVKKWFSAADLSLLGKRFVAGLPKTMSGCMRRAKKEDWISREVNGGGGPGGIRTEYQTPAAVLALIHSFLEANPDFFAKGKTRTRADLAPLCGVAGAAVAESAAVGTETAVTMMLAVSLAEATHIILWLARQRKK